MSPAAQPRAHQPATNQPRCEVTPRKLRVVAIVGAVALVVVFTAVGSLLRIQDTGAYVRPADQVAIAGIGVILAAVALLFTRPRLRMGPEGVTVRNLLGDQLYPWDVIEGLSFPDGASVAHLELPDYEYVTVMAIQGNDKDLAVAHIRVARSVMAHYLREP